MKYKKNLILCFLLAIVNIFGINNVYAAEKVKISFDYQSNVYYTRKGDGLNDSHQYLYYSLNGTPAFCIEPGVEINDWDYLVYGIEKSPFDAAKTHRLQLIGHYGYDYPGHRTQKYRMATQALIWETAKNLKVEFYTKANGQGNYIDISNERNEILRLVEGHYDIPSFDDISVDATYNKQIVLEDTNNVLSNFEVYDNGTNIVKIEGNKLYITPKKMANTEIQLVKKSYDNESTIVYVGENGKSQKLARFRLTDPVVSSLSLKTTGGTVSIEKKDSDTNTNNPQGSAKLSNAKYGVYDENNNLVSEIITNNQGKGTSGLLNKIGSFTLKEISAPEGYNLDNTVYPFEITEDNLNPNILVKDSVIKGNIKVNKVDKDNNSCKNQGKANMSGSKYSIYDMNNNLIETITINDNCTATSKSLPYGNYKVKEESSGIGYYIDKNTYNVSINSEGMTASVTSKEEVIKSKIKITKVDFETNTCKGQGEASLSQAQYNIYDSNNNLVDTLTIGSDCTAISKELPYDNYKIAEVKASKGYKIDENTYDANITNSNTINITSKEEVIKGTIKITKVDSENNSCVSQGEASLSGAKFEIKDKNNNVVDTLTIGEDCTATSKNLPYGDYKITEKASGKGYYLNEQVFNITIREPLNNISVRVLKSVNSNNYEITVPEEVIKNEFIFNKFYGNESTGFIYSEANAVFEIINNKNEVVNTFTTDKNGYAKVVLPYGNYKVKQTKGLEDYKMMGTFDISVSEKSDLTQIKNIKNGEITAKLKLIKIDSETKKTINLAGFKFKIKNTKTNDYVCQTTNKVVCEYETNDEGILLTPLPLFGGDYELEEIETVPNYLLSDGKVNFSIKDNNKIVYDATYGSIIEVYFENDVVKGKLDITKYGEKVKVDNGKISYEKELLNGVSFKLSANEDIKLQDGTIKYKKNDTVSEFSINNGKYTVDNLYLGKYCLLEKSTNNVYVLDNEPHCFELEYQDDKTPIIEKKIELINYLKKSDLEFTKTDLVSGEVIPNTKIEIFTDKDELIFSGVTDKEGKIKISQLPIGKYYILESEPATSYLINDEKVFFEIKENGKVVKASMTNKKITGSLELTKIDVSTSEPLPNTLLEIYTTNDELVFSGRTDENGKIYIPELEYNDYYIIESEAPEGYTINDEKMYFSIKNDGEIVKATITDEKIIIEVPITEQDKSYIFYIVSGIIIAVGVGIIIYGKAKSKED